MHVTGAQSNFKASLRPALIFGASLFVMTIAFILVFRWIPVENTPLGLDWRTIWEGIQPGKVTFGDNKGHIGGMFTPPWGILLLKPLGYLSFKDSWAIISVITLLCLVLSVPRVHKRSYWPGILLLTTSFPALRNIADGNIEGLVIGGVLLVIAGYNRINALALAAGLLLATFKFQEVWVLCIVMAIMVWKNWPLRQQLMTAGILTMILGISMLLWGRPWLASLLAGPEAGQGISSTMGRGSLIDITLAAAMGRLGAPAWTTWGLGAVILACTL